MLQIIWVFIYNSCSLWGLISKLFLLSFVWSLVKQILLEHFQVKVNGSNDEMLRAAAEQFGDKSVDEIMFGKFQFDQIKYQNHKRNL